MGFLDDLFGNSRYLNENRNNSGKAAPQPKNSAAPSNTEKPVEVPLITRPETGRDPDFPVPFGYKCNWLCVKASSSLEVIEKLELKNPEPSNWDKGIEMAYNGFRFVSPVLDGYVLVVNYGMDILTLAPELLNEKAKLFPELQFFVTQRVSDYHAWAKYINGVLIRGYGWSGCDGVVFLDEGELTPEEVKLGLTLLPQKNGYDLSEAQFPSEDQVLELAAEWGIDTAFPNSKYEKALGYICR